MIFGPADPESGSQKPLFCSSCSWNQSRKGPKISKAFLIRSRTQRNFAHTHSCWHCPQICRLRLFTYFL